MAEIRVQPKRRSFVWLWVLLLLLVVAGVVWLLQMNGVTLFQVQRTGSVAVPPPYRLA